jgi:hypothetical protein
MAVYPISAHIVGDADRGARLKRERDKAAVAEMAAWVEAEAERARGAHLAARAWSQRKREKADAATAVDDLAAIAESAFDRLRAVLRWADEVSGFATSFARGFIEVNRATKAARAKKSNAGRKGGAAPRAPRFSKRDAILKDWERLGAGRDAAGIIAKKHGVTPGYVRRLRASAPQKKRT